MLRLTGSLSAACFKRVQQVFQKRASIFSSQTARSCSTTTEIPTNETPELLFKSPAYVTSIYRLIGLSVYSQVVASLVYVEQMLFPSTPSNYSWGVQVAFASGLIGMSSTIPLAYFYAIRRNIFQVSVLKESRQLVLSHLGKGLSLVETKIKFDDIEPISRLSKNLRIMLHNRSTNTLDTIYLERRGKYLNRQFLEEIAKGVHTKAAEASAEAATKTSGPAPSKYVIRKKTVSSKPTESTSPTNPETPPTA